MRRFFSVEIISFSLSLSHQTRAHTHYRRGFPYPLDQYFICLPYCNCKENTFFNIKGKCRNAKNAVHGVSYRGPNYGCYVLIRETECIPNFTLFPIQCTNLDHGQQGSGQKQCTMYRIWYHFGRKPQSTQTSIGSIRLHTAPIIAVHYPIIEGCRLLRYRSSNAQTRHTETHTHRYYACTNAHTQTHTVLLHTHEHTHTHTVSD